MNQPVVSPGPLQGPGDTIAARLAHARQRIAEAGGGTAAVTIVAVTKGFDAGAVAAAREAGTVDVGETYAQELLAKAPAVEGVRWHFLGAPQRNKVARLAPVVACWQGVDRNEVIDAIAQRAPGAAVLVEVDLSGQPGRHGCPPDGVGRLVERGRDAGLDVRGLMTVAPAGDRDQARRSFATVASMAARLELAELSMGMSDDYDLAVAEGSTMVRLGRAIFGPRPPRPARHEASRAPR